MQFKIVASTLFFSMMAASNKGVDGIEFHTIRGRSANKHESEAVEVSSFQFIPFVAIA